MFLGIENALESALEMMNKGSQFEIQDTIDVIKELKSYGVIIIGGFILGNPDDNAQSFLANFEFAKKLKIDFPVFNTITPYPKTPIRTELLNMGLITNPDDYSKYDCWEVNVKTKHLSTEQIYKIRDRLSISYPVKSGSLFNLIKEFPAYYAKVIPKWIVMKPSDVFKVIVHGFSKSSPIDI